MDASAADIRLDAVPRMRGGMHVRVYDGEAAIYDNAHHVMHFLNTTAALIWRCCDGASTVEAIAARFARECGLYAGDGPTMQRVREDVICTLAELARHGLIDLPREAPR